MPTEDELERSIGERLKSARLYRRMTLAALAAELGLTYQQIHKYETGRNRISASTLFRIADALGFDPSFFFPAGRPTATGQAEPPAASVGDRELQSALGRIEDEDVRERLADLLQALQAMGVPQRDTQR